MGNSNEKKNGVKIKKVKHATSSGKVKSNTKLEKIANNNLKPVPKKDIQNKK